MPPIPDHLSALRPLIDAELSASHAAARSLYSHLPWADEEFIAPLTGLLEGGKRMRGLLCAMGYANSTATTPYQSALTDRPALMMAAAIEMYQASALVHDDVMDGALTRRGLPAVHVHAARLHTQGHLDGDSEDFGSDTAILAGDLLLSRAHVLACQAVEQAHSSSQPRSVEALHTFASMTQEVAVGQYLDIRNQVEPEGDPSAMVERAVHVAVYKSARYSVTRPVMVGMALGGCRLNDPYTPSDPQAPAYSSLSDAQETDHLQRTTQPQITQTSVLGDRPPHLTLADQVCACLDPLGIAFQLRDDDLGVFGDPTQTGKPAGDDIREGKRTALLALTLARLRPDQRASVMDVVGDAHATNEHIMEVRALMESCGARRAHEDLITSYAERAIDGIQSSTLFCAPMKDDLLVLARALTSRSS